MSQAASAATLTTIASFNGANGSSPFAGLTLDAAGNLYGTTTSGGASDAGTVYKITGGATSTPGLLATMVTFNGVNGYEPIGGLISDGAGNLYGTTQGGGTNGNGTVFRIPGGTTATPGALTILSHLTETNGIGPQARLLKDAAGNLYGTAANGGGAGNGSVFKVAGGATSSPGATTTIANFNSTNGTGPWSSLTADAAGNLYGTTTYGGTNNAGTVFKINGGTTAIPGSLTTLASFSSVFGGLPFAGLVADPAGNLYGTTLFGRTIFKISGGATPTPGALTVLATLTDDTGSSPWGDMIMDAAGNLYGTATSGAGGFGSVFKFEGGATSSPGAIIKLATFNGANGANPYSDLIVDSAGNLYGTTQSGGASDLGTVFKIEGSGFVVPEPTSLSLLLTAGVMLRRGRRRLVTKAGAERS